MAFVFKPMSLLPNIPQIGRRRFRTEGPPSLGRVYPHDSQVNIFPYEACLVFPVDTFLSFP